MITIRPYNAHLDYEWIVALYRDSDTFGGQYDDARDSEEKLALVADKILVAVAEEAIVGTVTIFEDGRAAWLYRFAVDTHYEKEVAPLLYAQAKTMLSELGHTQVLVYAPAWNESFESRYNSLGFQTWSDYTCYWQDI
jgi:hypothetical protein